LLGLGVAACFAVYQQVLIRHREPGACFQAFLNNNYLGLALFAGLFLDYALP
jgi:4-hydroxybenzoate polyprenyltransferase